MFELLLFSGFGPNKKRLQGAAGLNSSLSGPLTSKQNVGRSDQQKFTSPSMKSNNIIIREKHLIGSGGHGTFANLIYCLAISSLLLIQTGGEAKLAELESQQVGKPCICNSTFFKVCPPAGQCMENIIMGGRTTKNPRHYLPRDQPSWPSAEKFDDPGYDPGNWPTPDTDYFHGGSDDDDDYTDWIHEADPDHVPIEHDPSPFDPTPIKPGGGGYYGDDLPPLAPDLSPGGGGPIGMDRPDPVLESAKQSGDGDKVVRHRKVYLKPQKWPKGDVPIHPIKIRIPVRMPESSEPDLPAPQPMFKIKKYTTYESRPEIQMVPVTKTIIKPVGISPDQIIDETDGGSYRKMFV